MKPILRLMAAACVLAGLTAERASADIVYVYELQGATLQFGNDPAGALTGSFTMNADLSEVIASNIIAWNADPKKNKHFDKAEYEVPTTDAFVTKQGSDLKIEFKNNNDDRLTLIFEGGLATSGSTALKSNSSLEHQNGVGNRSVVSGTVTALKIDDTPVAAVPEPSAVAVVAICAPALLAYGWRRRRGTAGAA